jgi:serine/threonine protein phosphatase 1
MYYFIKHPSDEIGKPWPHNGYETTLVSYNEHFDKLNEHLELIINQPLFYNLEDCFISHAGISKYMKEQLPQNFLDNLIDAEHIIRTNINREEGIIWTRDVLLNVGKLQVVGHSIKKEVTYVQKSNAVYIDTGVYLGNKLSAVIVERSKIISKLEEPTHKDDIRKKY